MNINRIFLSSAGDWLRRLWILAVTVLLGGLLLLIGALIFLDGEDYKPVFSWAAETFFEAELKITGALRVHVSDGVFISAYGVQLKADDSFFLSADSLSGDIRLRDVVFGTLLVRDLAASNLSIKINESDSGSFDWKDFTLPPVIVGRARFKNVAVEYQELPPGTLHRFALSELNLDDVNDTGPVLLQASGILEGRNFTLKGTFPPLQQALDHKIPKPVNLSLVGEGLQAHLDGTITDPANGTGMDFDVQLSMMEARDFLEVLGDDIPAVGEIQASARLQGDYAVPGLTDLDVHMTRGEEVDLSLAGSVEDVFTGNGMNLHLSGRSSSPQVASWLLFRKIAAISAFSVEGDLREQHGNFRIKDLSAEVKTSKGLLLSARGEGELYGADHTFSAADSGVELKVTAPSTAALNLFQVENVPKLGTVEGKTRLIVSRDAIGFYDADFNVGSSGTSAMHLQGQIGRVPLQGSSVVSGINLKADIRASNLVDLAKILGYDFDHAASGHVITHLTGNSDSINLGQTDISISNKDGVLIKASGKGNNIVVTDTKIKANASFAVTASAPDLSAFSGLAGTNLPKLGAVEVSGDLSVKDTKLKLDQLKINIGARDQPTIRMNGEVVTLLEKGSTVSMSYDVAVGDLAAALTGEPPGYLGRMQGTADISDYDGTWGVEKFSLKSSDTSIYSVNIGGAYKDRKKSDFVKVNAIVDLNDPEGLGKALGIDLSGFSAYHSEGVLTGADNSITYTAKTAFGRSASETVINGSLVNGRPYFKGSFELPELFLSDFGFNPAKNVDKPLEVDLSKKGRGNIFSKKPFDLEFLNSFDLDFEFHVDQVESHGQLTIDSVFAQVQLKDGDLRVEPFKLVFEGGTTDVVFGLQASDTPAFNLSIVADDVKLGPMMAQVQNDVPITGYSNVNVDITARGNSPHEMVSTLNGKIELGFENAKIPNKYIQFLSVDVLGWAVSSTFKQRKYADLNCVVATFEATNGKIASTVLLADGPNVSVGGSIKLNLRRETMNIVLLPKEKRRLFSSITPVRIKGPMRDPEVRAVPAKAAIKEIGAMALVPYVYVPVKLIGSLWSVVDDGDEVGKGCAKVKAVTEEAEKEILKEAQSRN